jgi:hypothetical protein
MEFQRNKAGLMLPKQPDPKPTRNYKLLEVQDEDDRKLVRECLTRIFDSCCQNPAGVRLPGHEGASGRRDLIYFVCQQLLGDDFSGFEELC